jgi:hypothetical protein
LTPETVRETGTPPEVETGTEIRASFRSLRLEQKNGFNDGFGVEPTLSKIRKVK